ncbi:MAG: hypothetical protein LBD90_06790, partial [Bifidobacteriaceae bacterium]|nr:hypothetical protein [Bifidobacteriaceae bacterium]
ERDQTASPRASRSAQSQAAAIQPCASPPQLTVTSLDASASSLPRATVTVAAGCAEGDVLQGAPVLELRDAYGIVLAGVLDLSQTPLVLGEDPVTIDVTFPTRWFGWEAGVTSGALTAILSGATAGPAQPASAVQPALSLAAGAAGLPQTTADEAAATALKRQSQVDYQRVAALQGVWSPQLSSKYVGLVAEGQTWTPAAIWAEFLVYEERYPGQALLIDSTQWSCYEASPQFWITNYATSFPTADGALAWCAAEGWDRDHCFAKMIGNNGTQGTTEYLP